MSGKMIIIWAHLSACVCTVQSFSPILIAYEQRQPFNEIGSEFSLSSANPSCKRVLMIHLINLNSMEAIETARDANLQPNHGFSWWRIPGDLTFVHCRTPFLYYAPITPHPQPLVIRWNLLFLFFCLSLYSNYCSLKWPTGSISPQLEHEINLLI